jgi:hypothetical protein
MDFYLNLFVFLGVIIFIAMVILSAGIQKMFIKETELAEKTIKTLMEIMAILRYIAEKDNAPQNEAVVPEKKVPPKVEPRDWTPADDPKDRPFIRTSPQWIEPKEAG